MLSPSKYENQFVFEMSETTARKRALKLLNNSKPEHPPDIYFIRRNDQLLEKYLDKDEFKVLMKEVDPKNHRNYNLFTLDPREKEQRDANKLLRRNFTNPDDP